MTTDEASPLEGRTVVMTRAMEQQSEGRRLLEALGAKVLDLPALEIGPPDHWGALDDALAEWDTFHWLIVSSANGVEAVEDRLQQQGKTLAHRPASLKIAAVGRKTARRLEELGSKADFVPPEFVADSLIEHILKKDKDVFSELLTTDKFYVFHSGDNEHMLKYVMEHKTAEKKKVRVL